MNFTRSGEPTIFEFPIMSLGPQPVDIEGFGAHWLDANTILWDFPETILQLKLHYSAQADLESALEEGINGSELPLMSTTLTEDQSARAPHLSAMQAWEGDWSVEDAKTLLTTQAVVGGYDANGTLVEATGIQLANAIDPLYTMGEDDADEAQLGGIYTAAGITAALWAPTASNVDLLLYNNNKTLSQRITMTRDDTSGVWRYVARSPALSLRGYGISPNHR